VTRRPRAAASASIAALAIVTSPSSLRAHSGPPFPIVAHGITGAYDVEIWTDPDATDDPTPGGQFWVVLTPCDAAAAIPAGTRVVVAIRPLDRAGPELTATAAPDNGLVSRQFATLRMDHEGPFAVRVAIDGPLGRAEVTSQVDATYDLRPPPLLFFVYLLPFVAIGLLWIKLLRRRRGLRATPPPV
jgi:hypothetical protein